MSFDASEILQCSRCVMDTTDPDIRFDENLVCNHCHEFRAKEIIREREMRKLPWLYETIRKRGRKSKYDCLLGLSGGVDSSLCLHYLVENGLRPLCFSIDNGWNTPLADENIMRLVESLKVPFYRYTIDLDRFKELQQAFIKSCTANIEIPTDHILMAATYQMARENNIKYVISGGNLATEGIMPRKWGYQARDLTFIRAVFRKATGKRLKENSLLPTLSLIGYIRNRFLRKIKIVNLLDYYNYRREDAKRLLAEKYGWQDYGEKHCENSFTMWFQNYWLPTFFGIDKRKAHYSSLINSNQMTKREAVDKLSEILQYPPIIKLEGSFTPKLYTDYKNSEFWWNLFSKIYGLLKIRQ